MSKPRSIRYTDTTAASSSPPPTRARRWARLVGALALSFALGPGCETVPDTIEGKVVDVWGNPIEGATVMVVGGEERPLTDADGRYTLPRVDGTMQIKAGRKGFIQDHMEIEVKAGQAATGPLFELYPKPEAPGFYAVAVGKYLQLEPKPVKSVGNALRQFRGVADLGGVVLDTERPRIVFHTELRQDEIVRLGLALRRLELVGDAEIPGPVGTAVVPVHLYVDKGDIPLDVVPLRSRSDYLLTPKAPLQRESAYALQTQTLLTLDDAAFAAIPDELRVVFPFDVH